MDHVTQVCQPAATEPNRTERIVRLAELLDRTAWTLDRGDRADTCRNVADTLWSALDDDPVAVALSTQWVGR